MIGQRKEENRKRETKRGWRNLGDWWRNRLFWTKRGNSHKSTFSSCGESVQNDCCHGYIRIILFYKMNVLFSSLKHHQIKQLRYLWNEFRDLVGTCSVYVILICSDCLLVLIYLRSDATYLPLFLIFSYLHNLRFPLCNSKIIFSCYVVYFCLDTENH